MSQPTNKFALLFLLLLLFSCSGSSTKENKTAGDTDSTSQTHRQNEQLKKRLLKIYDGEPGEIRYFHSSLDLNNDSKQEIVAYVVGPFICGTGGCNTLVFSPEGDTLKKVADISVSNPPVIATQTRANGWLDLVVKVSGGGLQSASYARLKFNGTSYPNNPTVKPAIKSKHFQKQKILIQTFDSFEEGQLLRKDNSTLSFAVSK